MAPSEKVYELTILGTDANNLGQKTFAVAIILRLLDIVFSAVGLLLQIHFADDHRGRQRLSRQILKNGP